MPLTLALFDLPDSHRHVLARLVELIPPDVFCWAITGSVGLRLQGVDTPVHDIDIQAEQQTIYAIEKRLSEFMKTPVHVWESPAMRSLGGKAVVEGVEVELLANIAHQMHDGSWVAFTDFSRLVWIDLNGLRVPSFPLEDELASYEAMGRREKATLIRQTIQQRKT
jgi:hypothetical protein